MSETTTPHTARRRTNMPHWLNTAYPGTLGNVDLTKTPTTYLSDLYPNIWQWGPRGDIYRTQLTHLQRILDNINGYRDPFFDTLDLHGLDELHYTDVLDKLATHAAEQGLPTDTTTITHGMDFEEANLYDPAYDTTPAMRLILHPCWETHAGGTINFADFLGRFALISIHHAFFNTSFGAAGVMHDYRTFCTRWGIPQ